MTAQSPPPAISTETAAGNVNYRWIDKLITVHAYNTDETFRVEEYKIDYSTDGKPYTITFFHRYGRASTSVSAATKISYHG